MIKVVGVIKNTLTNHGVQHPWLGGIVIPMPATLAQLIEVRSQLVESAIAYLSQLADLLDQTYWMRRRPEGEQVSIMASEIAVEPFVLAKQERPRPSPGDHEGEGRGAIVDRHSPIDEIEAQRYELPLRVERQAGGIER